ncbi:hypothetical protein E4Q23_09540 [Candidatus Accumulibacter phosphatis]|jgi:hypothetical protein|uniref:Formylmethanofuran dehydrogenase subunit E domain-containing protein n=1 Tax=Candidatus Accumulibacter phosphatis TaxID=327160 RepID=A0ABX1TZ97_9PROT|nr:MULTISPECIES: hypothetical protein [Candidatus Accumulibacter]NMQ27978.1 hypothetical protein [Candidatus Accumulibacter phosphatis]
MTFPSFFAAVPTIVMRDRLAEFLGAAAGGLIEYGYADAVKLAGHSCPTVAGSYLLSSRALQALYPDEIPLRGELRVDFRDAQESAVTGVVAAVVGLLTGAAGIGGFKGLAGRFSRRELLSFGAELPGEIRFTRQDNGQSLCASLHLGQVPADSRLAPLLQALLAGKGDAEQAALFAELWQDRVRRILIEHFSDPGLVRLS